ncbi:spore germination protein [Cohnella hashimotonis]|uniref:Spore germination protein n=1 Tax=Cohnella hashimotonis TaxID=2826895 RepID=A0ABT6TDR0_9BACL|nr:spore germination protein [Cohnella hashimotonis]MDI4644961.1 spore germination protein [Cohnella hashimotonis]
MSDSTSPPIPAQSELDRPIAADLNANRAALDGLLQDCADAVFHPFSIGDGHSALLIYLCGLSDKAQLEKMAIAPLIRSSMEAGDGLSGIARKLPIADLHQAGTIRELVEGLFIGMPSLLVDGEPGALILNLADWEKRGIDEPMAESVVRGPREGFGESLDVNMSLMRRRLRTPSFKMKTMTVGRLTRTRVVVGYIQSVAKDSLVQEVLSRLSRIHTDGVLESANIEELIQDSTLSPFPQLLSTERPDVCAASLMEGKAMLMVEGTPFALIAPTSLFALLQSPEDYYQRFMMGTVIRWLRYTFFLLALLFPSLYVAILTYHQEMVPTTLLLSIAKSREDIPFPALVEALLMEISFEALREAGVRLPKQVGSAVSIVGALVIGQAATAAGLVSPPMVMVVALTGIASFMIPHYSVGISVRLLRFPVMLLAGFLGLLGLMLGVIALVIHLASLRSFGEPYLVFFRRGARHSWKDTLIRAPAWALDERPATAQKANADRQSKRNRPAPQREGG